MGESAHDSGGKHLYFVDDLAGSMSFVPKASTVFNANNQAMMNNAAYDAGNQSQIGGYQFRTTRRIG